MSTSCAHTSANHKLLLMYEDQLLANMNVRACFQQIHSVMLGYQTTESGGYHNRGFFDNIKSFTISYMISTFVPQIHPSRYHSQSNDRPRPLRVPSWLRRKRRIMAQQIHQQHLGRRRPCSQYRHQRRSFRRLLPWSPLRLLSRPCERRPTTVQSTQWHLVVRRCASSKCRLGFQSKRSSVEEQNLHAPSGIREQHRAVVYHFRWSILGR